MTRSRNRSNPTVTMDLDIDLGRLLRPSARGSREVGEPVQRVIYPMVPSWHREGEAAEGDHATAALGDRPSTDPLPLRAAEAWVPTQSARLGSWPGPLASNDTPEPLADPVTVPEAPPPPGSGLAIEPPATLARTPVSATDRVEPAACALVIDPIAAPVAAPVDAPIAASIASGPPPEGPAQRRNPVRTVVGAHGQRWLQALSIGLRPTVTARCHPHVVERLAAAWPEPASAAACLDDLLFNRRPGRRGFSLAVLGELCELQRALAEGRRR
jgi:hypothetical protein